MIKIHSNKKDNCFEACLISILELPLKDIPDFTIYSAGGWFYYCRKWCKGLGYNIKRYYKLPKKLKEEIRNQYYIGAYPTRKTVSHAVVLKNGRRVHDPDLKVRKRHKPYFEYYIINKLEGKDI
jgi:hypothetical protein